MQNLIISVRNYHMNVFAQRYTYDLMYLYVCISYTSINTCLYIIKHAE